MKEKERHWAIVLGWADGFDYSIQDEFKRKSYRLCAKFAYQSSNSMMQCDYDIDWLMPYNKDSGDVDDTEVGIYSGDDLNKTADWLWECYLSYFEDEIYECKKCANYGYGSVFKGNRNCDRFVVDTKNQNKKPSHFKRKDC